MSGGLPGGLGDWSELVHFRGGAWGFFQILVMLVLVLGLLAFIVIGITRGDLNFLDRLPSFDTDTGQGPGGPQVTPVGPTGPMPQSRRALIMAAVRR